MVLNITARPSYSTFAGAQFREDVEDRIEYQWYSHLHRVVVAYKPWKARRWS